MSSRSNVSLGLLSLFTSFGMLVCCALPSVLVLVGFGTAVASVLSAAPWLVAWSHWKDWVFAVAGAVIALNFAYVYRLGPRLRGGQPCPGDGAAACETADRGCRVLLLVSAVTYLVGFLAAYLVGPILTWLDG